MKRFLLLICIFVSLPILAAKPPLYGKVKVVKAFADYKVKVVTAFPDLKVQKVTAFPDAVGKWQFVDDFPDFTITFVDDFPDFTIQYVGAFPGVPDGSKLAYWSVPSTFDLLLFSNFLCYMPLPSEPSSAP